VKIIGLTGGIGMGKTTIARLLRRQHIPVFDADAAVHALQMPGGRALPAIETAFPGTVRNGRLDRGRLRATVLANPRALQRLEAVMHPMVRADERAFVARARRNGAAIAVLDIPLLFESGGARRVDMVMAVSAPHRVQRARVRARRQLTPEQIDAVLARQLPDRERCRRADYVIKTGLSRRHAQARLARLLDRLRRAR
jgi:dephospho-CoA kinase